MKKLLLFLFVLTVVTCAPKPVPEEWRNRGFDQEEIEHLMKARARVEQQKEITEQIRKEASRE